MISTLEAEAGYRTYVDWIGDGLRPVERRDAQSRANTCLQCPLHDPNSPMVKGAIASVVKAQVEMKNKMQLRVDGEKSLGICTACGCVMRLKIWVPLKTILAGSEQATLDALHPDCWIKKEQ